MSKELLNALCRERFDAFHQKAFGTVFPGVEYEYNWHMEVINEHLQALFDGTLPDGKTRLCINMPPRMMKSYSGSMAFPAWLMGKLPHYKIIGTSFKFPLAKSMAQRCRDILESDWYQEMFPATQIDPRQNEKHNFWTTQKGMYFTSAIEGITGNGADLVIIDDPLNPTEAVSDTVRASTNEVISNTIPTRFNDLRKAKWLMIMQRLHDDDPTGHFALKDPRWFVLKLPAVNRTSEPIVYELNGKRWVLEPNELLHPERLTADVLQGLEDDLGEYNFAGQLLQEPVPVGGGELLPRWIQYYGQGSIKPKEMNVCILVDPSGGDELKKKKKKLSDWTAMLVVGLAPDNNYYLLDAIRDRLNPTERIEMLFALHRKWNALCGKPPKVGYEKYGMMTDTHYINEKKRFDAYNFPLFELGGSMSKEERIRRLIPDMQNGRWYFPDTLLYVDGEGRKFDLVREIIDSEMATFPRSRFDDMIDALSRIKDMDMVFPKPKLNMTQKALRPPAQSTDWRGY